MKGIEKDEKKKEVLKKINMILTSQLNKMNCL